MYYPQHIHSSPTHPFVHPSVHIINLIHQEHTAHIIHQELNPMDDSLEAVYADTSNSVSSYSDGT